MREWTCLSVSNGPGMLPDEVTMALQYVACELTRRQEDSMYIDNKALSGHLSTDWKTYAVGERSGVLFRALIDYGDWNDCQVNFLMRRTILDEGADLLRHLEDKQALERSETEETYPVPELYKFFNITPYRRPS